MGLILGKISVETPKYELVLKAADYEIRAYAPSVIAEVTYDPALLGGRDAGFMILANYIGAVGEPQNSRPEKIPMTAPVLTHSAEKIAMTAPVVTSGGGGSVPVTMQFVLPAKYAKAEDAPRPKDDRVRIREERERKYGVVRFSGVATDAKTADMAEKLRRSLVRDGYKVAGEYVLASLNLPSVQNLATSRHHLRIGGYIGGYSTFLLALLSITVSVLRHYDRGLLPVSSTEHNEVFKLLHEKSIYVSCQSKIRQPPSVIPTSGAASGAIRPFRQFY